jgi:hypothetical protein
MPLWSVAGMVLIIAATVVLVTWAAKSDDLVTAKGGHLPAWLFFVLVAFALAFTMLLGWALSGLWSGALIDPTKGRMSLSRLQMIGWTVIVIPAFLSATLVNLSQKAENKQTNKGKRAAQQVVIQDPLDIKIPGELLAAMGLSFGSAFVSRLVLVKKADENSKFNADQVADPTVATPANAVFVAEKPEWRDLFRGDTVESRNLLDLGKVQLFYITAAILFGYAAVVATSLVSAGANGISTLPVLSETLIGLLAISHAGYLTTKATQ